MQAFIMDSGILCIESISLKSWRGRHRCRFFWCKEIILTTMRVFMNHSTRWCVPVYVCLLYVCCVIRMESRFSAEDIFIRDDLILMKASVTHRANLCNLLYILWLEGKWQANRPVMFRWGQSFCKTDTHVYTNTMNECMYRIRVVLHSFLMYSTYLHWMYILLTHSIALAMHEWWKCML